MTDAVVLKTGAGAVTVTTAVAVNTESDCKAAITSYLPAFNGGVYSPAALTVPPPDSLTDQFTAGLDAPVTVAVNCSVPVTGMVAAAGEIETLGKVVLPQPAVRIANPAAIAAATYSPRLFIAIACPPAPARIRSYSAALPSDTETSSPIRAGQSAHRR